jgi:hypothetical protein
MKSLLKLYVVCIVMGMITFPVFAFASSNSGAGKAGEGVAAISGRTVANLKYQLSNDPSFVNGLSFDLDGTADIVSVKLNSKVTTYTTCTNLYGYHWQCDFSSAIGLVSMDELSVIAVGS